MAICTAKVRWERGGGTFTDRRYSRAHRWYFDGGVEVPASSSPGVVRAPLSDPAAVDPEEALVAALSSCHMLSFLDLASRDGFTVDRYTDEAVGRMGRNPDGRVAVTVVTLRPRVEFAGDKRPTQRDIGDLHHRAHDVCFIASSVRTEVRIEPAVETGTTP